MGTQFKIKETQFFLNKLKQNKRKLLIATYYFSAFLTSSSSILYHLLATYNEKYELGLRSINQKSFEKYVNKKKNSEAVEFMSLTVKNDGNYILVYKELDSQKIFTIHISYDSKHYSKNARFLTKDKFELAINYLENQIEVNPISRFGWFGSGPCLIDKTRNEYRSDALDLYIEGGKTVGEKVVYSFCKYKFFSSINFFLRNRHNKTIWSWLITILIVFDMKEINC